LSSPDYHSKLLCVLRFVTINVMTNYSVSTVDEFIAAAPEVSRPHLQTIRDAVESVIPTIEKEIGYGKPYYKYHGWVVGFDTYAKHIGIEIWDGLTDDEREDLEDAGYKTGSRTFQVRFDQTIPSEHIKKLVALQVERNELKASTKK